MGSKWVALFTTNFLGVFNDNLLKGALIFIAIGWHLPPWLTHAQLISLVSASLVVPFLFLSPLAGRLAVKYAKKKVFVFFKILEIPIMMLASLSFLFEAIIPAVVAMLLMGTQSALFSPAKYGLIRDIGGKEDSDFGSGGFETMAFAGILLGTVVASLIADHYHVALIMGLFMLLALAGYACVLKIPAPMQRPEQQQATQPLSWLPWQFLWKGYRFASTFPGANRAVAAVSVFWMLGAIMQMNIVIHAQGYYGLSNTETGIIMALAAIGIAVGSWLAGVLLKKLSTLKSNLLGVVGMLVSLLIMVFGGVNHTVFGVLVFVFALTGGFYLVPNLTHIQRADTGLYAGQLLAYKNLVIFVFVLFGTLLFSITTYLTRDNSMVVFQVLAVLCVAALLQLLLYRTKTSPIISP